ncbi:hypothetical protein EON63_11840 [archaeon]|nr:MAG: hypothetical protein EON63_11840 [archaeon]
MPYTMHHTSYIIHHHPQGISNAVGLAISEKHLAAVYNRDGFPVVDHFTYVICGDGCLQEGVSSEACSLAGASYCMLWVLTCWRV